MLPVAQALLVVLAKAELLIVFDGSVVGRGCIALMASVLYKGRALRVAYLVIAGKKGHFPEHMHRALLAQITALIPQGARVRLLGDGEFDGTGFLHSIHQQGWQYVCRTACDTRVRVGETSGNLHDLVPVQNTMFVIEGAHITGALYGPVTALIVWEQPYEQPLYLVTNMAEAEAGLAAYRKRCHIETFFNDQKSRGFQLHKSHVSDPARVARLLLAACLAYLWVVYSGVCARRDDWVQRIHRQHRCDLSLFQLGLRFLGHCLRHHFLLPRGLLLATLLDDA
jgi:hypothetical protein